MSDYIKIDSVEELVSQDNGALVELTGHISSVAITGGKSRTLSGISVLKKTPGGENYGYVVFGGVFLRSEGSAFRNMPEAYLSSVRGSSPENPAVLRGVYESKSKQVLVGSITHNGVTIICDPLLDPNKVPKGYKFSSHL
jgi:hypothetical protein